MIALSIMYIPNCMIFYFCITWLPSYLLERHGFNTMNSIGNLIAMLNPLIVAYSVSWFASWDLPLYGKGALFLVGAGCWALVDPSQPVFAEA